MRITLNGIEFIVEEYNDGWGWITNKAESQKPFTCMEEATQDAMEWVRERKEAAEKESRQPDTYQREVMQFFNRRDYR